jgi:hypothetical protein
MRNGTLVTKDEMNAVYWKGIRINSCALFQDAVPEFNWNYESGLLSPHSASEMDAFRSFTAVITHTFVRVFDLIRICGSCITDFLAS